MKIKNLEDGNVRDLKRVLYTSSYDRGLEHLLSMWPEVKKAVPEAILDIYYGWQLFDIFYGNNPASMKWKEKILSWMQFDGITEHGRISQPQMEKEMRESGVWAYPTHFGEINCLSAIKAQAYGCEPVVVNYAALRETVQWGRRIEGDIYDKETSVQFKEALIDALLHPMDEKVRCAMMEATSEVYSWDFIAQKWKEEFTT